MKKEKRKKKNFSTKAIIISNKILTLKKIPTTSVKKTTCYVCGCKS